jgi:choline kinase
MVEIEGRSLLERQLDVLQAEHQGPIVLVTGYRAEKITRVDVKKVFNARYAETNMVWSLFCAENDLAEGAIVAYGDIVYSRAVLRELLDSKADIAVTVDKAWESYWRARNENFLEDAETLKLADDGKILEIGRKPKGLEEIQGQYMGLVKYTGRGIQALKDAYRHACDAGTLGGRPIEKAYMTDLIQAVIDAGFPVQSVPVYGEWVEVDSVGDLELPLTVDRLKFIADGLVRVSAAE